jgi:hypothetical protein
VGTGRKLYDRREIIHHHRMQPTTIIAAVSDLLFRGKIRAVREEGIEFVKSRERTLERVGEAHPQLLIVDLALKEDPIGLIGSSRFSRSARTSKRSSSTRRETRARPP